LLLLLLLLLLLCGWLYGQDCTFAHFFQNLVIHQCNTLHAVQTVKPLTHHGDAEVRTQQSIWVHRGG
jgi:hypothetical protein